RSERSSPAPWAISAAVLYALRQQTSSATPCSLLVCTPRRADLSLFRLASGTEASFSREAGLEKARSTVGSRSVSGIAPFAIPEVVCRQPGQGPRLSPRRARRPQFQNTHTTTEIHSY